MSYKRMSDIEVKDKRVLVRLDLNVPIKDGKVKDMTRIDASLPTIKLLMEKKAKIILMSHLGRPEGVRKEEFSLKPVAESLSEKLGIKVQLMPDCVGDEVVKRVNAMESGSVFLLENVRFHKQEQENGEYFIKQLAQLADVYVNDAFGTAHRAHASTYGLPLLLKKEGKDIAAGLLMDKELSIWDPVVQSKGKKVAIIGGAKLKEKMKACAKFIKKFDRIIIGGVVANVFMNAADYPIGDSRCEEKGNDYCKEAKEILDNAPDKISMPSNVCIALTNFKKEICMDPKKGIGSGKLIADVLPSEEDQKAIEEADVVVWFGPMGAYEFGFTEGTKMIVDAIAKSKGYTVIGGGDLAAAAEGVDAKISTGGGAAITYITKGSLDALEALKN